MSRVPLPPLLLIALALSVPAAAVPHPWAGTGQDAAGQAAEVDAGPGVVSGLVEDALGGAVAGALVRATCGVVVRETHTGADGRFDLRGLPAIPWWRRTQPAA